MPDIDLDRFRLRRFIEVLERAGEIERHDEPLDLADLPRFIEHNPRAVLLTAVGPERQELVANVTASRRRLAMAFGVPEDQLLAEVQRRLRAPAKIVELTPDEAPVQQVVLTDEADLTAIDEAAYPNMDDFFADLSKVYQEELRGLYDVGCRYAQIDETNLAYLCDPNMRKEAESFGEDPDALPKTYSKLINACIAGLPQDMTMCMHLCRGNFAGAWIAEGGYEPVAELLFNEVNVTGYFLEFDSERAGGFEPLRFLPKGKVAVLGLVTTKNSKLEIKDDIKRRIEQAAKFVDIDQLALSPQCGFSSGIGGETMTVEQEMAKLRLVVEIAEDVWGSA